MSDELHSSVVLCCSPILIRLFISYFRAGGSVDTELDRIHLHIDTPCQKAKKGSLFGSLERGMNRMICMLTPKKKFGSGDEPRKVKVTFARNYLQSYNESSLFIHFY